MRVGFDVSPLHHPHPRGVVRATRGLVEELERRGRLEVVRLEPDPARGLRAWRQVDLPRRARELELDGIHSPVSAFPWRGPGLRVQTVHELPWKHGVAENADLRHRFWARFGARRADAVICPSEHVARDLTRPGRPSRPTLGTRVHVVPWGVEDVFRDEPAPGVVDEVVPGRYRLPDSPLAICLGATREKKNLAAVIEGLAALRERDGPPVHLVVTGDDSPQMRRDLGLVARRSLSAWVSTPGWIEEADLPALLRLATVVCVLSRSEGFGFPVLEAMACGTPVLVPRGSAQAELAGGLGIAVEADDPSSVAAGLARAVEEREELRYQLSDRARSYSWARCAEKVETVWENLSEVRS